MDDSEFESGNQGGPATFPKTCSAFRKNEYAMIKGRPCKIVEVNTLETDESGQTNIELVGMDIIFNTKYEDTFPSTRRIDVPNVRRKDYQLMTISDDGYVSLLNTDDCVEKEDLRLPGGELETQIRDAFEKDETGILITVLSAVGEEAIIGFKNVPKD